ncbi:MAG TPA: DNA mismatch repair protein MutS [Chitinophagales bacterium]|nr:DNA mismatch repair protein MutS [Chitinophagales bacterium]HQW79648.1 DNA mismatch repair protein MutS [Chitinophagales bacterium]HRB67813.1 DNA mismatch repair protein MutS [Chitinophagales bacterium]HRB69369.1 DNA mismatch repair protein MutS [Chitinophagales bacterium]HRB92647.1 DNA mismatch repair protein MutS [Chitinophagales bacterium]
MAKEKEVKETPLMAQYNKIKQKYPDAILLFRVGDFYETFGTDAIKASQILGIVLTKRANGSQTELELAGFPHHSVETYLPKLVKAGYRVAICEQLEDPKMVKGIVKRGVTELITPGVAVNDKILDHKSNNFLASIYFTDNEIGISFLDISTGEFLTAEGDESYIDKLMQSFAPSEIIFPKYQQKKFVQLFGNTYFTFALEDWIYQDTFLADKLIQHFQVQTLKGYGIDELKNGIKSAGAILYYLAETEHNKLQHISAISRIEHDKYVWIDRFTARNLELTQSTHEKGVPLIQILDKTISPMGSRLLKRWIILPLKDVLQINERLDAVELFIKEPDTHTNIVQYIKQIGDLERLISKVPMGKINPREVIQLKRALQAIQPIKEICSNSNNNGLKKIGEQLQLCQLIKNKIDTTLNEDAPVQIQKGNAIKQGISIELDELRNLSSSGKNYLLEIQNSESERTQIPSLKIGFNNIFGYYLEVRNTHKDKVPSDWIRKQTLTGAERYITPELKEYEEKILGADEKIAALEITLFEALVHEIIDYIQPIQINANLIARLDCLQSFSSIALKFNYRRASITNNLELSIKEGRHPVIEHQLPLGEQYIPNDVYLHPNDQQIIIITGPNMSGKSAILRQTALIVLMAQIGCFVPAQEANIGIVDKIFTRVGASDNLSLGESTFMVEMIETAGIVNNISDRSLVILDEIGRGTSTYDGISIAWSLVEFLHTNKHAKPKTMFATHYHELNELADKFPRIKNYNVAVKETGNKVIFLRKLMEGGSQHSFGIHVAKMAGMPTEIIKRANEILIELESQRNLSNNPQTTLKNISTKADEIQLNMFAMDDPRLLKLKEVLEKVNINTMTPMEAMLKLDELRKLL